MYIIMLLYYIIPQGCGKLFILTVIKNEEELLHRA